MNSEDQICITEPLVHNQRQEELENSDEIGRDGWVSLYGHLQGVICPDHSPAPTWKKTIYISMVKRRNEEAVLLIQQTLPFAAQYYDSLIEKCLLVKASTIKNRQ